MRQSKLRAMAARPWLLLLCLALARAATATETGGFISIDCGFPGTTSYVDDTTTLSYAPDAAFTDDAGDNCNISAAHVTPELARIYRDVRSLVDGARNCYTLRSLSVGLKYLLRASFMYGNYDGLNRPPVFVQVCLVNTASGTPFICGLELRPLKSSIYPQVNVTQGLVLLGRRNFGPTDSTDIVRNMSFSGLNGDISSAFANLKAVQSLDLSHNNLTGSIPIAVSQLPSLTTLDLTGNQISGSIPPGLLKKIQDGSLNLIYADNPNLCTNGDSCQTEKGKCKLAIYVAVPMALVVVALTVLLCCLLLRRNKRGDEYRRSSLRLENRRFTYEDLEMITNNFQRVIGRGGFGYVYEGFLEDGTQVAVKMRSQSSNQGAKEFLTEAQILTRTHHKNLVSMIGTAKMGCTWHLSTSTCQKDPCKSTLQENT
ncbi:putative leucine-rich repeat receptor-like protein kinase At2g19210 isoform X2 [Miscanthus floridulus]|uniref:putative leucine-rich repeat receptor-like protein kinase At2g19210 isoform X2 n=1 Tax=Miscanthus floridulus TaxID=154761 RepID=UPI00345B43A1